LCHSLTPPWNQWTREERMECERTVRRRERGGGTPEGSRHDLRQVPRIVCVVVVVGVGLNTTYCRRTQEEEEEEEGAAAAKFI